MLQFEGGQYEAAGELIGLVLNHPALEHDSRHLAEAVLENLRNLMPAEQLEQAMSRGRAMEIETVVEELKAYD
jgi:hypothetical protein